MFIKLKLSLKRSSDLDEFDPSLLSVATLAFS